MLKKIGQKIYLVELFMLIYLMIIFFFIMKNSSGIIDFYFSCNDFYSFEIAICFNALCFDGQKII